MEKGLQQTYAPNSTCFGCGPKNPKGLQINSVAKGDSVVLEWKARPEHDAFPGFLNGGIIGALLDCHSNATAAWTLMKENKQEKPPTTVTSEFAVKLLAPTPSGNLIKVVAKPVEIKKYKVVVDAELYSGDALCATCRGTFVAVKPEHPAYNRW